MNDDWTDPLTVEPSPAAPTGHSHTLAAAVRRTYGFELTMINSLYLLQRLLRRSGPPNDCAVIVTLDP
jgi:hypothetical protein